MKQIINWDPTNEDNFSIGPNVFRLAIRNLPVHLGEEGVLAKIWECDFAHPLLDIEVDDFSEGLSIREEELIDVTFLFEGMDQQRVIDDVLEKIIRVFIENNNKI